MWWWFLRGLAEGYGVGFTVGVCNGCFGVVQVVWARVVVGVVIVVVIGFLRIVCCTQFL